MRHFPVSRLTMLNRSFSPCRRVPQSAKAWRVTEVGLMFNRSRPKKDVPETPANVYPVSGRELLNILSGYRNGDLSLFNV
jgi:hypothetical protein